MFRNFLNSILALFARFAPASVPTNTFTTYGAVGQREDLTDIISNIDPVDTPFFSNISKGDADAKLHEWQTEALAAVDGSNAQLEGDDVGTFDAVTPTERIGNYTQISRKTVVISESEEEVDKAGRDSEMAHQIAKKGKELRRDMETILLQNQGAAAGSASVARKLGSVLAFIKSNDDFGAGGASPSWTNIPTAARTDGTQRTFTETQLKAVMQLGWEAGAKFKILMVGGYNKTIASGFAGIATKTYNIDSNSQTVATIGSVDVYVGDFHTVSIVPNRFQRGRDALLLDNELVSLRYLRKFRTKKLGETGDNQKRLMVVEYTLRVENEKGLGLVADLCTAAC